MDDFRLIGIRQRVDMKRATTAWKDIYGDIYLEDVDYLLEKIAELEKEFDNIDGRIELANREGHDEGWDDGYEVGLTDGRAVNEDWQLAYDKGYQAGVQAEKLTKAIEVLNKRGLRD